MDYSSKDGGARAGKKMGTVWLLLRLCFLPRAVRFSFFHLDYHTS